MEGVKHDSGKPRFDLIPTYPLEELARVFATGAAKYSDRNWEEGLAWGRVYRALLSHANAWWGGERVDREDGQHHLAAVAFCAFALMDYEARQRGEDNRPPPYPTPDQPALHPATQPDPRQLELDLSPRPAPDNPDTLARYAGSTVWPQPTVKKFERVVPRLTSRVG